MNVGGELPQLHDLLPTLDVLGIRLLPCLQVQRKKATGKAELRNSEGSVLSVISNIGVT